MSQEHLVIIGNGPSGYAAALTLREKLPGERITLISRERQPSYFPRFLPDFIAGKMEEEQLYASSLSTYKENDIKLRSGQQVVDLDLNRRELILDHKERLPFDGLIIAVGGKPRIPEPFLNLRGLMMTLKTIDDARDWISALIPLKSILIIGGDLTSFALAGALRTLDKQVYFLLNEGAFWPLRGKPDLFKQAAERLALKGIEVLQGDRLKSITRSGDHHYQVRLDRGTLEVGLVGAFFGLFPDVGFLSRTGLTLDRGVLVDEYLRAGFQDIYATGDCAQIYHPEINDYWVSIGHQNAVHLGRTAAANLAGGKVRADVAQERIYDVDGIRVNTSWWLEY
jgi:NADPH-dependent 2,4-dienoyl-CoA reductase/sulfur reductase-like enzyme